MARKKGQRRYVTVLFSDVCGSSEHAESLDPEDYAELLSQFRNLVRTIVPQHGGSIARLQGDGVLALFGEVEAREDDGRRATEAALNLHAEIAKLSVGEGAQRRPMQLHTGIHAGLVLLIEGDIEVGRFDVVGEVPNTASRICNLAGPGEILVSDETLGPQSSYFRLAYLQQVGIKGRSRTLNVLRIEGRALVERRYEATAVHEKSRFIGRAAALTKLLELAAQARTGTPSVVVVVGEAGIGKTRTIDELKRQLNPLHFRVLQGYCENYLGAQPLQPILHWLRAALGWSGIEDVATNEKNAKCAINHIAGVRAPEFASLVSSLLGHRLDAPSASTIPYSVTTSIKTSVVVDFIELLSHHETLVLVLDDLQWIDDASRYALSILRARKLPMLLVLSTRPQNDEYLSVDGEQSIYLNALDVNETKVVIETLLPDANPFTAQEINRLSEGSPLFIEELCDAAKGGQLQVYGERVGVAWINALIASRVASLPEATSECLLIASVIGYSFAHSMLEKMMGARRSAPLVGALERLGFLVKEDQPGRFRFKHILTREAVYGMVELQKRRTLHRLVAEELLKQANLLGVELEIELLSYHYDAANESLLAAQFAEAAGDKALKAMSLDQARSQYTTALRALDRLPSLSTPLQLRWCAIAERLGQTCVFDPLDVTHGVKQFERAASLARLADNPNAVARAEYWLGYVNYGKGHARDSVRHCEIALEKAVELKDLKLLAQIQATLGQALASAGQYERALPLMHQAVQAKQSQSRPGSGTAIGSAYTLGRIAYTLGDLGRFEEAYENFEIALGLLGDGLHSVTASVRELMAVVYLWQGRWQEALEAGQMGAQIALECRSRYLVAMGRALSACAGWALDQSRGTHNMGALTALTEATQWIEKRGGAVSTSLNYGWLVEATVTLGERAHSRRFAAMLFKRARAHDRHGQAIGCRALARHAAQEGQWQRATHYLRLADHAAESRGSAREIAVNQLERALIASTAGSSAQSRTHAEQAAQVFDRLKMASYKSRALEILNRS